MSKEAGFLINEDGQGMVEYALILALVGLVVVIALVAVGKALLGRYNENSNVIMDAFSGKL